MKRTFWFSAGYALGLGSSVWVHRRVRSAIETYTPEHVRRRAADRTLCGVRLQRWMRNGVTVVDPLTGSGAYPDCKVCARLSRRHGLPGAPLAA